MAHITYTNEMQRREIHLVMFLALTKNSVKENK